MRLALISDLHGNLTALEAVIERLPDENLDGVVGLGDISSNGPSPRECLARVLDLGCPVILGNADEALLERREDQAADDRQRIIIDQTLWAREQLTGEDLGAIAGFLPTHRVVLGPDHALLCFHGSPRSNREVLTATTPDEELDLALAGFDATLLAGGHTHQPLLRRLGPLTLINPGSVGMPFVNPFRGGELWRPAWAEYAVVESRAGALNVEFRRAPFDFERLRAELRGSAMPHADAVLAAYRG